MVAPMASRPGRPASSRPPSRALARHRQRLGQRGEGVAGDRGLRQDDEARAPRRGIGHRPSMRSRLRVDLAQLGVDLAGGHAERAHGQALLRVAADAEVNVPRGECSLCTRGLHEPRCFTRPSYAGERGWAISSPGGPRYHAADEPTCRRGRVSDPRPPEDGPDRPERDLEENRAPEPATGWSDDPYPSDPLPRTSTTPTNPCEGDWSDSGPSIRNRLKPDPFAPRVTRAQDAPWASRLGQPRVPPPTEPEFEPSARVDG